MSKVKRDSGPTFLYLFDADAQTVGVIPSDIVQEDGVSAYEIVDAGGGRGNVLRKKTADTTTKWCFFNSYETFLVPIKACFHFYMTNLSQFQFMFGVNVFNTSNTGGRVTGWARDAVAGQAKHTGWRANTNSSFVTSDGGLTDLEAGGINYLVTPLLNTLYIAEVWRDQVTGRQKMRVSADQGETWMNVCEHQSALGQSRVAFCDGTGATPTIQIKRVEVLPLA